MSAPHSNFNIWVAFQYGDPVNGGMGEKFICARSHEKENLQTFAESFHLPVSLRLILHGYGPLKKRNLFNRQLIL